MRDCKNKHIMPRSIIWCLVLAGFLMLFCGAADAQSFEVLQTTLESIVTVLQGAGIAVVTVAIVWAGYRVVFQHGRVVDVIVVVFGAVLIGGAATIAKWLIPVLQ